MRAAQAYKRVNNGYGQNNRPFAYREFNSNSFGRLVFDFTSDKYRVTKSQDYADLADVDYHPIIGVTLTFRRWRVTLEGKCLKEVAEGLDNKTIGYLVEGHMPELETEEGEPYISRIFWEKMTADK